LKVDIPIFCIIVKLHPSVVRDNICTWKHSYYNMW